MQGLTDDLGRAKSNIGFVDFVLMPLISPMFRLLSGLHKPEEYLEENRAYHHSCLSDDNWTRRGSRKRDLKEGKVGHTKTVGGPKKAMRNALSTLKKQRTQEL